MHEYAYILYKATKQSKARDCQIEAKQAKGIVKYMTFVKTKQSKASEAKGLSNRSKARGL